MGTKNVCVFPTKTSPRTTLVDALVACQRRFLPGQVALRRSTFFAFFHHYLREIWQMGFKYGNACWTEIRVLSLMYYITQNIEYTYMTMKNVVNQCSQCSEICRTCCWVLWARIPCRIKLYYSRQIILSVLVQTLFTSEKWGRIAFIQITSSNNIYNCKVLVIIVHTAALVITTEERYHRNTNQNTPHFQELTLSNQQETTK